ncbi:hypothetical protein [Streptomyces vinaceus]|uniref:hypothetical protein n=1 Tax=Streptomyces vinaceus TaxID=1960 RepID=UPI00381747CC
MAADNRRAPGKFAALLYFADLPAQRLGGLARAVNVFTSLLAGRLGDETTAMAAQDAATGVVKAPAAQRERQVWGCAVDDAVQRLARWTAVVVMAS